jgi:HAD superfamily hydrolase (TIGR01509 family)
MTAAAVLFDMDGLLVDSEPLWYAVEEAAVMRMGGTWGPEHQIALVGGTLDASCRYMIELTGASVAVDELSDLLVADMAAAFRRGAPPLHDGALELIDGVRAAGVRTGLVSSSYRVIVDAALDLLGPERFDVSIAGDEVERGKPDPEPYRAACHRLGVAAAETVVLEDAVSGVMSAEAAGCVVVAVPSVAAIAATSRRPVVPRLADVDVDWLLSLPNA